MLKKLLKLLLHRCVVVAVAILMQVVILFAAIWKFNDYFVHFYWVCMLLSLIAVVRIVGRKTDPGYKIAWIIPIMAAPVFGGIFYFMFGVKNHMDEMMRGELQRLDLALRRELLRDYKADSLLPLGEDAVVQARYLERTAGSPVYGNTETEYFPEGELMFHAMLRELKQAKKYIFLEYFIVEEGEMWEAILSILLEKARVGVEVRLIYDDMGCMFTLPRDYSGTMEKMGIHCVAFNRFLPILNLRLNNRDHRKMCIIDGTVAFTGGINLADEYINAKVRFGHWKDGGILLRGDGVWSMTVSFLSQWHFYRDKEERTEWFCPRREEIPEARGFVQPYWDTPLDEEAVGQTVYLNLISKAKRYVYIMTPYLIIDDATITALTNAAKGGVDVRIMTPHIPDKKTIFEVTRAHYELLLEAGVKIYEYTPGFLHAKAFAVDDFYGTAGTVNLDYRSLFLHFENGVLLYGQPAVAQIKQDFLETQKLCQAVTLKQCRALPWWRKLLRNCLRVFAPLM